MCTEQKNKRILLKEKTFTKLDSIENKVLLRDLLKLK